MKNLWKKTDLWYRENYPEIIETFNAGASDTDFEELKKNFGFELPKGFVDSYKVHNGQDTGAVFNSAIIDPDSEGLSSIQKIISTIKLYKKMNEDAFPVDPANVAKGIKPVFWNEKWLPIMEDGAGNSYFLDLDPAEGGRIGQVVLRFYQNPSYELVDTSLKSWIKGFVDGNLD
ncbi:MAG: hypothetical protein GQ574_02465 [Crocinitomix sp.]|nr:hypothetical protein [Crocinitomix sp.]